MFIMMLINKFVLFIIFNRIICEIVGFILFCSKNNKKVVGIVCSFVLLFFQMKGILSQLSLRIVNRSN